MKKRLATLALLAVPLVLSGCTGPTSSVGLVITHEGTSPLDDDPFVIAAHAAELGATVAWNTADFTIPELTSTTTAERIAQIYESYRAAYVGTGEAPEGYGGPPIWTPITVAAMGDDAAQIDICTAAQDLVVTAADPSTTWKLVDGTRATIAIERDPETGNLVIADSQRLSGTCDASAAQVSRFDPAPVIPQSISDADITKPSGYQG